MPKGILYSGVMIDNRLLRLVFCLALMVLINSKRYYNEKEISPLKVRRPYAVKSMKEKNKFWLGS